MYNRMQIGLDWLTRLKVLIF